MRARYAVVLSVLAGFAAGAIAVQGLHAQAKPPVFAIAQIEVRKPDEYVKEYVPAVQKALRDAGGKFHVAGGKIVAVHGTPPMRVAVIEFESVDKAQAAFRSTAYTDAKKIGDRYSEIQTFIVEGLGSQ